MGTKLISYKYDAWGNVSTTISHLGNWWEASLNPFRYRGYYYDTETGFYYLNSRYYNPEWGRFINADGYVSTGTGLLGYNMYAYCNNNPVMYVDPDGEFPWLILAIVVVAAVFVADIIVSATTGNAIIGPSKEEHYARNQNQKDYIQSLGNTDEERIERIINDWERQKDSANRYHRFTYGEQDKDARYNKKFMSPDKRMEVVICFPPDGRSPYIVKDPYNEGTYNFGDDLGHIINDVYPYYKWGNSTVDSGINHLFDRIIGRW
ncbi:MAG: RHS repeat-associated core domain-containing protein [Clostridia bacterium]|nr:RHS repeat-associated core domain-containing protein [Clostridia bacterium]